MMWVNLVRIKGWSVEENSSTSSKKIPNKSPIVRSFVQYSNVFLPEEDREGEK